MLSGVSIVDCAITSRQVPDSHSVAFATESMLARLW